MEAKTTQKQRRNDHRFKQYLYCRVAAIEIDFNLKVFEEKLDTCREVQMEKVLEKQMN